MDNQEEQNIEVQPDPYLESPKAFHLEMPPYHNFDLSTKSISNKIFEILSNEETIDAYCIWCEKEGVFRAYNYLSDNVSVPYWTTRHDGLIKIEYRCTRNDSHAYHTYYFKAGNFLTKVGQFPSVADFQIPQVESYRKILDEEQYKEFTRGIGLSAHGVGIGSFVYLRRVFENLIEEAHVKAQSEDKGFSDQNYMKARMDDKIQMVKDYLPEFLVENRTLYAIMSKGIHDLSEDECLQYFETVKIGIEQILDEKITAKEKADKAKKAREAIQKTHGKISNS
jgi:hypothetical protein